MLSRILKLVYITGIIHTWPGDMGFFYSQVMIPNSYDISAKKSLHQLKQLYFEMKEDVFGSGNKYGYDFDTKKMEEVLRRNFTPEMKMTSVLEPK